MLPKLWFRLRLPLLIADSCSSAARNTVAQTKSSGKCLIESRIPLAQKVTIGSMIEQKEQIIKVEGFPVHHRFDKLLDRMRAQGILSLGGHVAKFLVLQGKVVDVPSTAVNYNCFSSASCLRPVAGMHVGVLLAPACTTASEDPPKSFCCSALQ